eukprot:XP_011416451.1 PREDICTED: uncharacterized protein LOC105320277 [Crassostrea gigas]
MDEVDILYDILMPNVSTAEETVCTISPPLVSSTPKRKPTWTDLEQSVLLEEVTKREKSLFGKFKGCGRGKKERETAWEDVAKAVSQVGVYVRTGKEAGKQYANLKCRAKDKISQMKRPKTGGGPKPQSPTPIERAVIDSMDGRPSLQGLDSGIDTGDVMDFESSVECNQSTSSSLSTTSSTVPAPKTPIVSHCGQSTSNKKQSLVDLQKQLLMKEMEKMEMEMEVMELKKEKLKEEIHLLKLKKEKLISEQ